MSDDQNQKLERLGERVPLQPLQHALARGLEQQQQLRAPHGDLTDAGAQDQTDRELVEI